ncbi:MAG: DUF4124 domain-containing protein [Desulfobacteraceae bacterium]|nr:DUF4124 domain-containing protein [Desulfobacteraceae bacterium]
MKRSTVWTVLLVLAVCVGAANADIYRYTDADGNVRFTDDPTSIPAQILPKAEIIRTEPAEGETPAGASEPAVPDQKSRKEVVKELEQQFAAEKESLAQEKARLAKEGRRLQEEKEKLNARREKVLTSRRFHRNRADSKGIRQLQEVDEQVQALDREIQAHNQKVQAYDQRARAYDEAVAKANEMYRKE